MIMLNPDLVQVTHHRGLALSWQTKALLRIIGCSNLGRRIVRINAGITPPVLAEVD